MKNDAEIKPLRRLQLRENSRAYRAKQAEKGLYQTMFWMTLTQAAAVRRWLTGGGDVAVFSKDCAQDEQA